MSRASSPVLRTGLTIKKDYARDASASVGSCPCCCVSQHLFVDADQHQERVVASCRQPPVSGPSTSVLVGILATGTVPNSRAGAIHDMEKYCFPKVTDRPRCVASPLSLPDRSPYLHTEPTIGSPHSLLLVD